MENRVLLRLEQVADDDTGINKPGELDFAINQYLYDYIKQDYGLWNVVSMLQAALDAACRTAKLDYRVRMDINRGAI